jgi:Arc/MetJ-type ribon-helix-helix transcriptional regulator
MSDTITFRPDADTRRALSALMRDGRSASAVVRAALLEAARHQAQEKLRTESRALADDPADRAEAAQVLRDMETLRAW